MRIALVTSDSGTAPYGTGVAGLARALVRHQHEVIVYARRNAADLPGRERTQEGYEVARVPLGPARPMSADAVWSYTDDFARFLNHEWAERDSRCRPLARIDGWPRRIAGRTRSQDSGGAHPP